MAKIIVKKKIRKRMIKKSGKSRGIRRRKRR